MGPLVHEETDRVAVNRHFQDEVGRRAGFHRRPYHSVMVRMYQSKQEGKYDKKHVYGIYDYIRVSDNSKGIPSGKNGVNLPFSSTKCLI
jgi:hypothetical protein